MKKFLRIILAAALLLNGMAAFQAYKFSHYYDNGATRKKNAKDLTFWEKAKLIVAGQTNYKLKNRDKPPSATTIFFYTTDSIRLEGWHFTHTDTAKGTVILFHGHGGNKSGVALESKTFYDFGYNVLSVDFRAHGSSDGNTCSIGMKESMDVKAAYDHIQSTGEKNIILWGISMGAASIAHAVESSLVNPQKIVLEMPFASLKDAVNGRMKMMGLPKEPASTLLTFWGGIEQGFWAFDLEPSEYVKHIQCPVLLQWGRKDPRVGWKETELIYNNIKSRKKLVVYEMSGHESLCNNENGKWKNEILNFLAR